MVLRGLDARTRVQKSGITQYGWTYNYVTMSGRKNTFFVIDFFILSVLILTNGIFTDNVLQKCHEECQNRMTQDISAEYECNGPCEVQQCFNGCSLWSEATSTSCQNVCNSATSTQKQSILCTYGCSIGTSVYVQNLKDELGRPAAPHLVNKTHNSVTIQWEKSPYSNISFLVQWKYEQGSSNWEYYDADHLLKTNKVKIKGLHPYTKYKFRVAWILLPRSNVYLSDESVSISTNPHGAPSSPPIITSLAAVGSTKISVTWEPPYFINGPIVAYDLELIDIGTGSRTIKEHFQPNDGLHYMFTDLTPKTSYNISIKARNSQGMGPSAHREITTGWTKTPDRGENGDPPPQMILATKNHIYKRDLYDLFNEHSVMYQTENSSVIIKGFALHAKHEIFWLSDSLGRIHRVNFEGGKSRRDFILSNIAKTNSPTLLSVDWLNDKLYIVEKNQISRCSFRGENYEIVISGITAIPSDIQVDPFNGYLYWVSQGDQQGGLYRIDLEKVKSTFMSFREAELVKKDPNLYSLAIDYENMRLLLPDTNNRTFKSYNLDASDGTDIRKNSVTPDVSNIKSVAFYKPRGTLCWTNGMYAYGEDYKEGDSKFFHNDFLFDIDDKPCNTVRVYHKSAQPDPIPFNPVEEVQAIFKEDMGKIHWKKPRLLGGLGQGAYQDWSYEVNLIDMTENRSLTIQRNGISSTQYTMDNLLPNKTYVVRVRAYSVGGKGPWSANITGKTVRNSTNSPNGYPYIIWSARKGILKSDLLGEEVEQLIDKERFNQGHITDMSWYRDTVFLNTNNSHIFTYDMSSSNGSPKRLENITNIVSIAVDWLAPKLYRSSPIHEMISRSNLDGSHSEHLPIQTMAKELAIDSPQGRLYWATAHSVQCSKLNGENIHIYFETGLFSGKLVMGLTLDFDAKKVYWMVRSHEGAFLYSANKDCDDCTDLNNSIKIIGTLPENDVKGPLWYFSDHLYWLHERKEAMVSDLQGGNVATLRGLGLTGLRSLIVIDPSLQPLPHESAGEINVVPNRIKKSQISLEGRWNHFTIYWQPVTNVNYGTVFYEVVFYQTKSESSKELVSLVTTHPTYFFNVSKPMNPCSRLTLSIRPYTYWASARPTVVNLTTPEHIPSKPTNPRIYVSFKNYPLSTAKTVEIEFRWSPPEKPNGKIEGYQVFCWQENNMFNLCGDRWHNEEKMSFRYIAKANASYHFKVRTKTAMGAGNYSDVVLAKTTEEHPVPKLLLARTDSIYLADVDTNEESLQSHKVSSPVAISFLNEGSTERVYWLEDAGVMSTQLSPYKPSSNVSVVKSISGSGKGMALDWIGRSLFWSERHASDRWEESYSVLWAMDLNNARDPSVLINTTEYIGAIEVDPFSSTIIYVEIGKSGKSLLKAINVEGQNPRMFFSQNLRYHPIGKRSSNKRRSRGKQTCNCPLRLSVGNAITIDRSKPEEPEVLWVDAELGHIYAADMRGCFCRIVVNALDNSKYNGLPPTSITADKSKIYWSNAELDRLFSIDKSSVRRESRHEFRGRHGPTPSQLRANLQSEPVSNIREIRAIGDHLQPYPEHQCLAPLNYKYTPMVQTRTPNSITLTLGDAERFRGCEGISMSTIVYTVYYGKKHPNGTQECDRMLMKNCKVEKSYNTTIVLKNLDPYTYYTVQVAVSNYYTVGEPIPGPMEIFQTKEGAPTAPVGVTAVPISPSRIDVFWEPPIMPNGKNISYEVRWHPSNKRNDEENAHHTLEPEFYGGKHVKSLTTKIEPGTEYIILVRAYSVAKDLSSDSTVVSVTTFDLPNNVTLENVTSRQLSLRWRSPPKKEIYKHKLEYLETGTQIWKTLPAAFTEESKTYSFDLTDLKPKASYEVQLQLSYYTSNVTFTWPPRDRPKFVFQTLGDLPDVPGAPEIKVINKDIYQVWWEEVDRNGGEDLIYELQFLPVAHTETSQSLQYKFEPEALNYENLSSWNGSSPQSSTLFSTLTPRVPEWQTIYNGSQNQWFINDLPSQAQYEFRVRAITEYGASNFSEVGAEFFLPEPGALTEPASEHNEVVLIAVLSASALVVVSLFVALYFVQKRRDNSKKAIQDNGQIVHGPDLELATLRELPRRGNFVEQDNALYNVDGIPTDEELALIPHISRKQIGLTKFLGSGAFGEVFEGTQHDIHDETSPVIKVAIKTLRKGATEQEKAEFLKEAKLMSNFQHEHILKLLGICLNNNPNFIILELMEGGDLLSYLRSNRPTAINPYSLTLDDLLGICVDVAKGCQYLEEMHFVHRDLAARNCLVSSHNPALRIVKIGDFGLARDVYKNDYYRKEGEGLLPVRWMAPESLVDGVFTSQSDIWAFGVLLWEVMTLGQQPYPARTNLDVLHHVRGGGRLDKPGNCPDDLHELMLKCWNFSPENRPTFTYCLETLEDLKHKNSAQNTPMIPHNYIGRYYDGFDNLAYHSEDLTQPQSQEELAKIRDSLADQHPLLSDRPTDSDNANSPNGGLLSTRANDNRVRRGNSMRGSETSESSSLLENGAMSNHQNPSGSAAKYLEVLPDNDFSTDTNGYEVPLPVLPSAVALERLKRQESTTTSTTPNGSEYAQMNHFLTKNLTPTSPTSRRIKLPPTCLTAGSSTNNPSPIVPAINGVVTDRPVTKSPSTNDNYLIRGKKSSVSSLENGRTSVSPMVTSALLKPSVSETRINNNIGDEDMNGLETKNPFYRNNSTQSVSLQCTPSVHRCGTLDNPCRLNDSLYQGRKNGSDTWSLSSASTSTCLDNESKRNSGISTLSALSNGVDLSYTPKSSWC